MEQIVNNSSLSSLKSRPNKVASKYQFDKEGSQATSSTASVDETSSLQKRSPVPKKLVMTISTPSKTKPKISINNNNSGSSQNDGSFKIDDDSNWWQSPKISTDDSLFNDETEKAPELPKLNDLTEDETSTKPEEKMTEKKKKVKRISMIKVKASDMAGLSTHQFQQTGNFEADQRELHKIVMKLKADKTARERSSKTEESTTTGCTPLTSKPRSQSKMRTRKTGDGESNNGTGIHQRSKSTSRRSSDAEVVDLTPETRSKSVTRRSRSVARKDESDDSTGTGNTSQKAEETKRSGTRGRSVGTKRISGTSGREASEKSLNSNGKVRERSRSVARQRISDVDNYDADGDDDATDQLQRRTHNIVDLATGLALVDRDTRSRSVARTRPGEEEVKNVEDLMASQKSLGSRSKNSSGSRSKNSIKSGETDKEKQRSKSVGRRVRSSDETSSHQSSSKGGSISSAVDKEKRRSKSTGRTVRSISEIVSSDKEEHNGIGKESSDSHEPADTGKSIPWNEFLKHAQSG